MAADDYAPARRPLDDLRESVRGAVQTLREVRAGLAFGVPEDAHDQWLDAIVDAAVPAVVEHIAAHFDAVAVSHGHLDAKRCELARAAREIRSTYGQ